MRTSNNIYKGIKIKNNKIFSLKENDWLECVDNNFLDEFKSSLDLFIEKMDSSLKKNTGRRFTPEIKNLELKNQNGEVFISAETINPIEKSRFAMDEESFETEKTEDEEEFFNQIEEKEKSNTTSYLNTSHRSSTTNNINTARSTANNINTARSTASNINTARSTANNINTARSTANNINTVESESTKETNEESQTELCFKELRKEADLINKRLDFEVKINTNKKNKEKRKIGKKTVKRMIGRRSGIKESGSLSFYNQFLDKRAKLTLNKKKVPKFSKQHSKVIRKILLENKLSKEVDEDELKNFIFAKKHFRNLDFIREKSLRIKNVVKINKK